MCEHNFRISPNITYQFLFHSVCIKENVYISNYIICQLHFNIIWIKEKCEHPFRISPYITCQFLFNLVSIKENV